ncbi:hypothetical protein INT46_004301 [Mucor plumbeus]|uniref:Uncharacterized protein n=1 Tax=Mucor plumbeus TaxID=97098 RepID=A0A8H7R4G3_9FUNG|nr:hypothetical protein INT46_004301 [Mucor plumbeus]
MRMYMYIKTYKYEPQIIYITGQSFFDSKLVFIILLLNHIYTKVPFILMKFACLIIIFLSFLKISYAATGTLRVYNQKFVNPKAGNLKIPSDAPAGDVPSIDNGTDKDVSVYDNSDCTGSPVIVIPAHRATIDFRSAWGGCLNVGI